MSLISLHGVSLTLANHHLLEAVDWQIQPQDQIALVGRNGAGKSSLLRLLQGELIPDSGQITRLSGLRVASLRQSLPNENKTVAQFLMKELGEVGEVLAQYQTLLAQGLGVELVQQKMDELQAWEVLPQMERMASHLDFDLNADMLSLSGGVKRRVLLAAALLTNPDVLLLDEPTNHLDIQAIEWLESYLKSYSGSLLVVTHDRAFLEQVANRIVEIEQGKLYHYACDYETYLDRKEARHLGEQRQQDLFDKRLAQEEAWIREGVKARRTRNEGRVRKLKAMREAYQARRQLLGKVLAAGPQVLRSGALVLEANHLHYVLEGKMLLRDFSLRVMRGDKIGILGPNGCGKTTLLRLLLGELAPDSGHLRQGTSLKIAYFDQLRQSLDENETVMGNVADGAEYVLIQGKPKHVATYLREFLFPPERFHQRVSTLSGGERNRLVLAKQLAKPVNLLVMDEPTNDLDIETLELLENWLIDYSGTLLLISHDRTFINQVVTSVLVYEGEGQFKEYVGGFDDYRMQKKQQQRQMSNPPLKRIRNSHKLSFKEQRELSQLPQAIEALEHKIAEQQSQMAQTQFYQQTPSKVAEAHEALKKDEQALSRLYVRWEELEGRD